MKRLLLAIQFLTIFPVKVRGDVDEADMLGSSVYFPIAGLMQGLFTFAIAYGMSYLLPPSVLAAIVLALLVLTNGGFHLDGLADTSDGLACKGDIPRRLEVMRDGAVGPIGAMVMFITLIIKFAALSELATVGWQVLGIAVIFMPTLSKWAMLVGMRISTPARNEGLGKIFIGKVTTVMVVATGLFVLLIMIAYIMIAGWSCEPIWHMLPLASLMLAFLIAWLMSRVALKAFNGQSGDTLGATGEIVEAGCLIIVCIWSNIYIS